MQSSWLHVKIIVVVVSSSTVSSFVKESFARYSMVCHCKSVIIVRIVTSFCNNQTLYSGCRWTFSSLRCSRPRTEYSHDSRAQGISPNPTIYYSSITVEDRARPISDLLDVPSRPNIFDLFGSYRPSRRWAGAFRPLQSPPKPRLGRGGQR